MLIEKSKRSSQYYIPSITLKMAIAVVCLLCLGLIYNSLLTKNDINLAGLSGLAQSLAKIGLPYTLTLVVLNALILCSVVYKRKYGLAAKSFAIIIVFGIALDFIPEFELAIPPIVALLLGSLLAGAFFGVLIRIGASSGGFDLLSLMLQPILKLPFSVIMTTMDMVVIVIWCLITCSNPLLSITATLICNVTIDVIANGTSSLRKWVCSLKKAIRSMLVCLLIAVMTTSLVYLPHEGEECVQTSTLLEKIICIQAPQSPRRGRKLKEH